MRSITPLFAAAVLTLAACDSGGEAPSATDTSGPGTEAPATAEAPPEKDTYTVNGTVKSIEAAAQRITIAHDDVPGYMPAMTMPFYAPDAAMIADLAEGDAVRFTFRRPETGGRHDIVEIEKR